MNIIVPWDIAALYGVACGEEAHCWVSLDTTSGIATPCHDADKFGVMEGEPVRLSPGVVIAIMQAVNTRNQRIAMKEQQQQEKAVAFNLAACPLCGMPNFDCGGGCHE